MEHLGFFHERAARTHFDQGKSSPMNTKPHQRVVRAERSRSATKTEYNSNRYMFAEKEDFFERLCPAGGCLVFAQERKFKVCYPSFDPLAVISTEQIGSTVLL